MCLALGIEGAHILRFSVLRQGRIGEVLFASNIDSPTRKRATNGECELKTRGCDAVRCVRSIRGKFADGLSVGGWIVIRPFFARIFYGI